MFNLNVMMVMWRELFEAVLVVTIVYAVLAKRLPILEARKLTVLGVLVGIGASVLVGLGFQYASTNLSGEALEYFQIAVLVLCAGLMTHMCLWMRRHAASLKNELQSSVESALGGVGVAAVISLIALAITREGLEVVVFLWGMGLGLEGDGLATIALSAGVGAALTVVSGYCLARGIKFIKPKIFFKVTGIFLLLTASSLLLAAVQRSIQGGFVDPIVEPIWDMSAVLDESSGLGSFLAAIAGYQSQPALISVLIYALYWGIYFLASRVIFKLPKATKVGLAAAALMLAATLPFGSNHSARAATPEKLKLRLTGYGDMQFAYRDYGPNGTLKNGAQKDSRLVFDATRFSAKLEGFYLPYDVEFEAELEFEHGGTGAAMELEYEEAGEFENEVEKGGEVLLEEFYLKKVVTPELIMSAGRIKVAFGLLSLYPTPMDYLAVRRSETETTIIPESWNEMGLEAVFENEDLRIYAQVVNGLDSTGFSSQYWIGSGHQSRFEEVRATDLAGVLRGDVLSIGGVVVGMSAYHGGTTRNRPQADLVKTCNKTNSDEVAPCGYVDAPVTLVDAHATVNLTALRANAVIIWGKLANSAKVSERNRRLPNGLGAARTPVAEEAYGAWGEVGYDIAPALGMAGERRFEPFLRIDQYDTMYKTSSGQPDNPRFSRRVLTTGVAYTIERALTAKFDVSRRTFGAKNLRAESSAAVGLGFMF